MRIIIGHSNMDADCLGSIVLASYLYPDAIRIRSSRMHPVAHQLYALYEDRLAFASMTDLPEGPIDECIVVDTHATSQIREYFDRNPRQPAAWHCIDHHQHVSAPVEGTHHLKFYGANCSVICELLMEAGIRVGSDDATIALAGIFADTGSFTHDGVCAQDFAAARYLIECGANVRMVRKFLHRMPDEHHVQMFHDALASMTLFQVKGLRMAISHLVLPEQVAGLNLVAERLAQVEPTEGLFCVFELQKEKQHLIIARSSHPDLDVAWVLGLFGGGGHPQAASALLKKTDGVPVVEMLRKTIELRTRQSENVATFMTEPACVIQESWTLLEASIHLEHCNESGAPVLDAGGGLMGMISLRDIQKGRKAQAMHSPVRAYMTRKIHTVAPSTSVHDLEALFLEHEVSRMPVIEQGRLVGLVRRSDFLRKVNASVPV